MLQPLKRAGGRRYYRPGDVELAKTIDRLLNREGYTIRGACKLLEDAGSAKDAEAQADGTIDMFANDEDRMLGDLKRLRKRLTEMQEMID